MLDKTKGEEEKGEWWLPKNYETDKQAWKAMLKENNLTEEEALDMVDKTKGEEDKGERWE